MIPNLLWVALGGAIGSGCRYVVGETLAKDSTFPVGTFTVNLVGSFLLGLLLAASFWDGDKNPGLKLFLTTGMMGGFTTYSAFSFESLGLLQKGEIGMAALYMGTTFALCLLASFFGYFLGRHLI